jgi:hypothetical protein
MKSSALITKQLSVDCDHNVSALRQGTSPAVDEAPLSPGFLHEKHTVTMLQRPV